MDNGCKGLDVFNAVNNVVSEYDGFDKLSCAVLCYTTCIRPAMLYGSETWPTKIEDIRKMQRSEMRMLRWMTGMSLSERKSNECVRSMLAIDDIAEVM